jgi:hypothetical protein
VKLQPTNTPNKPVLDLGSFQQLLAAAYTLQEQNDHLLLNGAKADFSQTFTGRAIAEKLPLPPPVSPSCKPLAETELPMKSAAPMIQSDLPVLRRDRDAASSSPHRVARRRIFQSNELFWRAARVVAMAAVLALLLGGSIDRLSPLPAGLALPQEVLRQQVPFRREKRIMTVLAQSSGTGSKIAAIEPTAAANTGPAEPAFVTDQQPETSATPASMPKTIVHSNRHSTYASEADIVAPNAVVRYGVRSATARTRVQKKP